eukprot:TRINITY_DN3594_c0_g1_i1.p1 TRINITY_DN3594_c0_g1~~TRINITY_DN3594_c0_g1_i1.p1  ORF type:complete len:467 (-),score=52.14 TRINITY_DN3594_c0_g1_i1:104-1504(-)
MRKWVLLLCFFSASFFFSDTANGSSTWERWASQYSHIPKTYFRDVQGDNPVGFSVVIPAYNCGKFIVYTLASVNQSIEYFITRLSPHHKIKGEVIVVVDNSPDNTADAAKEYAARANEYSERLHSAGVRAATVTWKVIDLQLTVYAGAARNIGVLESSGDMILFSDGDDLFLEEHIYTCFAVLLNHPNVASIVTGVKPLRYVGPEGGSEEVGYERSEDLFEDVTLHPYWRGALANTHPNSKCLWRSTHNFIDGWPEGLMFRFMADITYTDYLELLRLSLRQSTAKYEFDTVAYVLYPGNAFEGQLQKWTHSPDEDGGDSWEMPRYIKYRDSGEREVRHEATRNHHAFVAKKLGQLEAIFVKYEDHYASLVASGNETARREFIRATFDALTKYTDKYYTIYTSKWKSDPFPWEDLASLGTYHLDLYQKYAQNLRQVGKNDIADLIQKLYFDGSQSPAPSPQDPPHPL